MRTFLLCIFWITNVGRWVLAIPVVIIAPLKLVLGTAIGLWAYSTAKKMPVGSVRA